MWLNSFWINNEKQVRCIVFLIKGSLFYKLEKINLKLLSHEPGHKLNSVW